MIVVADAVGNLHLRYPGELTVCLVRHSEHPGATFHSQPPRWGGGCLRVRFAPGGPHSPPPTNV